MHRSTSGQSALLPSLLCSVCVHNHLTPLVACPACSMITCGLGGVLCIAAFCFLQTFVSVYKGRLVSMLAAHHVGTRRSGCGPVCFKSSALQTSRLHAAVLGHPCAGNKSALHVCTVTTWHVFVRQQQGCTKVLGCGLNTNASLLLWVCCSSCSGRPKWPSNRLSTAKEAS